MRRYLSFIVTVLVLSLTMTFCDKQDNPFIDKSRAVSLSLSEVVDETKSGGDMTNFTECVGIMDLADDLGLSITVSDNPVNVGGLTKGTNTTTRTFPELYGESGFKVYAEKFDEPSEVLFRNETFTLDDGVWSPVTPAQWPDYGIRLYAWAPGEAATLSFNDKTFSYTVENINEEQTDLLVGRAMSRQAVYGTLPISFTHALCEVKFTTNEKMPAGSLYSLKISGVKLGGTYDFAGNSWTIPESAETGTITLDLSSSPLDVSDGTAEGTALTSASQTFFVIPQSCTEDTKLEISFKSSEDAEVQTHEINLPDGFAFSAGQSVNFAIGSTPVEYSFELPSSVYPVTSFTNTNNDSQVQQIAVVSTKKTGGTSTNHPWHIKEYKINGVTKSFTNDDLKSDGGLDASVSQDGTKLTIKALRRTGFNPASHEYWVNSDSRENYLDWSPSDWSEGGESKATVSNPLDLSRFDFRTEETGQAMTTANCYIIRHSGTYKIPLVYGNAITDGKVNEKSYYNSGHESERRFLNRFYNHLDKGIKNPFIEYNTLDGSDYSEDAACIKATGCSVVWQENEILTGMCLTDAETVSVDGTSYQVRYLQFTANPSTICQSNSVICIYDDKMGDETREGYDNGKYDDGEAIWSWNIWMTNDPCVLEPAIEVTNKVENKSSFSPFYLVGWVDSNRFYARDDVELVLEQEDSGLPEISIKVVQPEIGDGDANRYQFGRKDAFSQNRSLYLTERFSEESILPRLNYSIMHPSTCIDATFHWYLNEAMTGGAADNPYYNLWTGKYYGSGRKEEQEGMNKTVYDPSPVGYKVPAPMVFSGFVKGDTYGMANDGTVNSLGPIDKAWVFKCNENDEEGIVFKYIPGYNCHQCSVPEAYRTLNPFMYTSNSVMVAYFFLGSNFLYYNSLNYLRPILEVNP